MNDFIDHNPLKAEILSTYSSDIDSFAQAKSKQIVFVTFNDEYGGSEVLWFEIAQKLALIGHDIQVICKHHMLGEKRLAVLADLEIKIVELEAVDSNALLGISCDLVVFSTGDHNAGGALFHCCYSQSIDYIIINQLVKEIGWPDNQEFLQTLFEGYRNAKATFFTSQNNINIFEAKMKQRLDNAQIHYNPIDIDRNDYVQYPPVVDSYSIAFPARLLIIHKGQDLLLKVLSQSKWQNRNLIVNFYGQGPDEHSLNEMVRKYDIHNVNFLGHVDSMRTIWEDNHAFILTSHMEGLPIVLLSAMFAGRASIVTNVGGIGEVVADECSGFISDAISVEAIDRLLERAWSHRARWKQMGESARLEILKRYPIDPMSSVFNTINS
jgi:glycosyltransferase involved in cell wall biosynthesis